MTKTGPGVITGALLAPKGAATPAGFRNPRLEPLPSAPGKPELGGPAWLFVWLVPVATIVVAISLTAGPMTSGKPIAVAVAAPPDAKPAEFQPPVESEIIQAPEPPSETLELAAHGEIPVTPKPVAPVMSKIEPASGRIAVQPIYRVQLHALGSKKVARREWRKLKRSHDDLFGKKNMTLVDGKNKSNGIRFVRLQAGPFHGYKEARNLCSQAEKRRLACVVVQR